MVYRKHPPTSRRYHKGKSSSNNMAVEIQEQSPKQPEAIVPAARTNEKKNSNPLSFLSSILGTGARSERSGSPLFKVLNYEIYFDDLLLIGLILLLITDKNEDDLLLVILLYLLLDIF